MKKIILTLTVILAGLATTFAQTSATVNLNVKLNAIQSIVASASNVDLEYRTINDYNVGVQSVQNDHLTVYSTGGFVVKVSSSVKDLTASKGTQTIESSGISVVAAKGTTALTPTYTPVNLGVSQAALITSTVGGVNEKFNVTYKAAGGNTYVNKFFKGTDATATIYSTVVTYSIEAN